jgi:hypothetical protein
VNFLAGSTVLGSGALNGNTATLSLDPAKFPVGQDNITAAYSGDPNFASSVSAGLGVLIQTNTTLTFVASPDSVQQGQTDYLLATVTRVGGSGAPVGNVTFTQGGSALGNAPLDSNGKATLPLVTTQLPLNSYPVTASYAGSAGDLPSNGASSTFTVTPAVDVLTLRNNSARTGLQPAESILTLANVNANTFGKVFSFATDGFIYAQPLFVSNYMMNDGKLHNVLFVATSEGTMYAFDADNKNPAAGYLWRVSVVPPGEQPVTIGDVSCTNTHANTTLIGTPVIDRTRGVLYVVGKTKLAANNTTTFYHRIHALNLADGTEKLNGPTQITASVPGSGAGSVNGTVVFNELTQNQRAGLLEAGGSVWIAWASHCDNGDYHGWVLGYNASDVSQQTAAYNNTPDGSEGGIWMSGGAISSDNLGHIFTVAGNGTFDVNSGGSDYGDSVQRLDIGTNSLTPGDWFAPSNQASLDNNDLDFGTISPLLFDDPSSSVAPHLLATADKTGRLYLVNRDALGSYDSGTNGPNSLNGDMQDFASGGPTLFANAGFFNNHLYVGAAGTPLVSFDFNPGSGSSAGFLDTTASMSTAQVFGGQYSTGGMQPVLSANGTSNAIVWGLDLTGANGVLYAFDANELSTQLYSSATNSSRDQAPLGVKFSHPVVANGRVYVAGQGSVAVYGLLPQ